MSEETQAKMARMAAAAAWGLGNYQLIKAPDYRQRRVFLHVSLRLTPVSPVAPQAPSLPPVPRRNQSLAVNGNSRGGERSPVKTLTYHNVKWWRKAAA